MYNARLFDGESVKDTLNAIRYPLLIIDGENMPVWANRKFLSLHRMSRAELGRDRLVLDGIMLAFALDQYNIESPGGMRYFQLVRSMILLQGQKYILISFIEISKARRQQSELQVKRVMFEQLSERLPEGIVLAEETIHYSNPVFEKIVGYSGAALESRRFVDLMDAEGQLLYQQGINKLLLKTRSKVESVLMLKNRKGPAVSVRIKTSLLMSEGSHLFLNIVTDITSEQIELESLRKLAYFDALTNIYNRRKFNELLVIEYKRAKRYRRQLSAIFFDIDHFKKVNDCFGHDAGDSVLKQLASIIPSHLRETDFFARWGGEEFIILLPETLAENALVISENLRTAISGYLFPEVGKVTISLGITSFNGKEQVNTLIKRLDKALYQAKEEGRNRSVLL